VTLEGRRVIVTGATRGIGAAVARALDAAGAKTLLVARTVSPRYRNAAPLSVDLTEPEAAERVVRSALQELGGVDAVISNAGAFSIAPVEDVRDRDIETMIALNVAAPLRLVRACVPVMRGGGRGHIVTIGSIADRHTYPGNALYAATKFAGRAMHQVVREELRGTGIRASLVSPGPVNTPLWDPVDPDQREGFTPRARMLSPDDVADAVIWTLTRPDTVNVDELRLSRS
jgi:NADP-dependent 3-hydroxy acid dehydrogenase YdfG